MTRAFDSHDHATCRREALAAAEAACAERGERLTPVRRRTLEILLESHRALGAYDVLERLREDGFGSQPPVAYRALSFLVEQGLVHRIEALQAFVACARPGRAHEAAFLVCRRCRRVAEEPLPDQTPTTPGFAVERRVVEMQGLCPDCRNGKA